MFVILLDNVQSGRTPLELIRAHVEHLRALDDAGALVYAGPFSDFPGGMYLVRAPDKAAAEAMAAADPFVSGGSRRAEVRTWELATRENGYLLG